MTPFLKQIAEIYYKEQGSNISDTCFVFPSRRAGKFFIEHLKNISKENILAPECLTISEFFDTLSPKFEKEEKRIEVIDTKYYNILVDEFSYLFPEEDLETYKNYEQQKFFA